MAVPNGTPGAGDSDIPSVETAVVDPLGDPYEVALAASRLNPPEDETQEVDASTDEPVAADSPDDADPTAATDEDADLAAYPEAVREKFKALDPEERKALYEEAERRAEARIKANEEKTAALAAAAAAQETRRKEILARTGQHVGAEAQTVIDPDGTERVIPSYDELVQLSQTQRGRNDLWNKYGLDDDGAERQKAVFEGNQRALDASAEYFDNKAWHQLDQNLKDGIRANGLDPDTILSAAKSPTDLIGQLLGHLSAKHEAEMTAQKAEFEGRLTARDVNAEGLRGRALAGSSRALATGGRSAGHTNGKVTAQQLIDEAGSVELYIERAQRGDYAGLNLSD